ncbi:hypothetical protein AK812_SmicGene24978 [Symbiodinium microadriaticum]|uniref:PDZ domain-containing protein n=1 Tax=Symbiodinium microadriaticum TaxID=2951 RepID=A0A1Q9DD72_SYMMI|nr:hypothetical protein AK812_SmicGene24978 [Symbiodinium microadriaticum]
MGCAGGRGVDVITDHEGEVVGIAVSQVAQVYTMVDRIIGSQRILALPLSDRYSLAGKVAAVPDEHGRLIERLASAVATSFSEVGALNALYLMDICKDLVPGFKDKIPEGRLEKAAELSPHSRAKDFVLQGQKPPEWARAEQDRGTVILLPEEETDLLTETGRAVGDATKFVGGAAFGGVGLVTDTLGITKNAEDKLASTAEDAVDLVGSGVSSVVGAVDQGLDGTAKDLQHKGVVGTVGDGVADAELEDMQVTLLQAKIQLGRVLVETDERRDLGSSASTSEFLRGVEQLEARVTALSSRLERMKTRTPWFFQPFDCLVGIVRKMGDFLGDLVLHPRSFAWQQLGVFCLCLAGVCVGALQLKQHRFLSDKTAGASATAMGLSIGLASVFVAGAICHPLIPWLLIIVDIVSDFVSDTVTGIADGVHGILNYATGTEEGAAVPAQETHLVKIVIAELFGAEKTLGLRIESRVVTAFTKEEAVRLGWRLGDCILAVGRQRVSTQEVLLTGISSCKEALRMNGTPIEFLVERMGARP